MSYQETHSVNSFQVELSIQIGSGHLDRAFDMLNSIVGIRNIPELYNQFLLLKSNYSNTKADLKKGRLNEKEFSYERKKVTARLLDLISDLDDLIDQEEIQLKIRGSKSIGKYKIFKFQKIGKNLGLIGKELKALVSILKLNRNFEPIGTWEFKLISGKSITVVELELLPNNMIKGEVVDENGIQVGLNFTVFKWLNIPIQIPLPNIDDVKGKWNYDDKKKIIYLMLSIGGSSEIINTTINTRIFRNKTIYGEVPGQKDTTIIMRKK